MTMTVTVTVTMTVPLTKIMPKTLPMPLTHCCGRGLLTLGRAEGSVDPVRDLGIIAGELRQKDLDTVQRLLQAATKAIRSRKGDRSPPLLLVTCAPPFSDPRDLRPGRGASPPLLLVTAAIACFCVVRGTTQRFRQEDPKPETLARRAVPAVSAVHAPAVGSR